MNRHNYYVPTVKQVVLNRHAQRLRERRVAYVRSQMDGQFDGGQPSLDGMRYRGISYKLGEMLWAIEELQDEQKVRLTLGRGGGALSLYAVCHLISSVVGGFT